MDIKKIKEKLDSSDYSFLKENNELNTNIALLTVGGSMAYGMDVENSDIDIRGIYLNQKEEILTGIYKESYESKNTDTVIYSLHKILSLLMACNPNTIEMLGCKSEHYLYISDVGQEILDNKKLFLSKRCINSFGGYANQQLRRLQNAMARDDFSRAEREEHILGTIQNMQYHLKESYPTFNEDEIKLYIDSSDKEDMDTEIFMDLNAKHFSLRDFRGIISELTTVINEYSKLNKRNDKKDIQHLAKHMAHLLRLYMMSIDILEKQEIITYREKEHNLLINVRNGAFLNKIDDEKSEKLLKKAERLKKETEEKEYTNELEYNLAKDAAESKISKILTGIYQVDDEFWKILSYYEQRFNQAKKNTKLPEIPDIEKVRKLQMDINYNIVIK